MGCVSFSVIRREKVLKIGNEFDFCKICLISIVEFCVVRLRFSEIGFSCRKGNECRRKSFHIGNRTL